MGSFPFSIESWNVLEESWRGWACGVEAASGASPEVGLDASGALGTGAAAVAGGAREVQRREGHGTMRLRQCWERGVEGGLTLLLDGVKFMFFLWK